MSTVAKKMLSLHYAIIDVSFLLKFNFFSGSIQKCVFKELSTRYEIGNSIITNILNRTGY